MEYFKEYAPILLKNGYQPIPIRPKSKIPFFNKGESWQVDISAETITRWAANGRGAGNIAVKGLGGLDFDIKNKEVSNALIKYLRENIDENIPIRVGQAPKFLIPVSSLSDIEKKWKNTWYDKKGEKHEIEFLCPGDQYFLVYGIHPNGHEFTWVKNRGLLDLNKSMLPVVDALDLAGIEDAFDSLAAGRGWTRKGDHKGTTSDNRQVELSFEDMKPTGGESPEKIKQYLDKLPIRYCDDRDEWIRIGSAIHHGTGGSEEGFELFKNWSKNSKKYSGRKDVEDRWESFSLNKHGNNCATIASLVHILKEEGVYDDIQVETSLSIEDKIKTAKTKKQLRMIMSEVKKNTALDNLSRSDIASDIRDKAKSDFKSAWKLSDILKKITPQKNINGEKAPDWIDGWIYITNQDMFGRVRSDIKYKRSSFCGMYNRELADRDDLDPKFLNADRYALDLIQIDYVHEGLFYPGMPDRFIFNGNDVYNTYDPDSIGERKPERDWTEQDIAAIKALENHIRKTFTFKGEANLLLDIMAHVVQNPGKRVSWMLILCGCEGDGKTMIGEVISRAVGEVNSGIINAKDIINSNFTDWAAGNVFKLIEELRASGQNRYQTVDDLKTFITNKHISIHPKYQKPYIAPNTATLIATTNHPDAIPYQDDSRRFTVITSKWINQGQIFKEFGSDYFYKLFHILESHAPAINQWLSTLKISDSFNCHKLPVTESLIQGIQSEKNDLRLTIENIISCGEYREIGENVIILKKLRDVIKRQIEFDGTDLDVEPTLSELKRALRRLKYKQSVKQYNIFGKGTLVWLKEVEENRQNILNYLDGDIENEELPF